MEEHSWSGVVCRQEVDALKQTLVNLISRKDENRQEAAQRYEKAKDLAWENEAGKLIDVYIMR